MAYSLRAYASMLRDLAGHGYAFHPIRRYFESPAPAPCVYLRHDVDRLPGRAVALAEAEADLGVASTFYFRCDAKARFPVRAIERVAGLGHEVGFHYESLSRCKGDPSAAVTKFAEELAALRQCAPILTVAPHGAPLSSISNMAFSGQLEMASAQLLGDATDMDFSRLFYITDTGGTFGSRFNLRDRPEGGLYLRERLVPKDLAGYVGVHRLEQLVISCHPERWPLTALGLLQASLVDTAANGAKVLLGLIRKPAATGAG